MRAGGGLDDVVEGSADFGVEVLAERRLGREEEGIWRPPRLAGAGAGDERIDVVG